MRFIDSCGASQQRATPKLAHAGYTVGDGGGGDNGGGGCEGDDVSLGVGGRGVGVVEGGVALVVALVALVVALVALVTLVALGLVALVALVALGLLAFATLTAFAGFVFFAEDFDAVIVIGRVQSMRRSSIGINRQEESRLHSP